MQVHVLLISLHTFFHSPNTKFLAAGGKISIFPQVLEESLPKSQIPQPQFSQDSLFVGVLLQYKPKFWKP